MSANPGVPSAPETRSYEDRVRAEMRHFRSSLAFDELPPAHHYWSNKYLRPEVARVFEIAGIIQSYAHECAAAFALTGSRRLLSIGSGQGTNEVALAKQLRTLGFDEFRIDCLELVPDLCEEGSRRAREAGVADHLRFIQTDINAWAPAEDGYAFVVANQILHHVVELEHLFDGVVAALAPRGRFATRDMIGRNGHRCWPETKAVMDEMWPLLPKRCTYDHRFERFLDRYPDRDCSTEGFEGIRAQDILPLLLERFHFEKFVAFGGLMERFVGRAFGLGYRVDEDEGDRALVDLIYVMNRRLIDAGVIKPTQMIATMALEPCETRSGFGWSPRFALRPPDA